MTLLQKIRALFRKEKLDADMSEEMRAHLEMQAAENVKRGMSTAEANYAARRAFGGEEQIKERCRDQRGWMWLEQTMQDLRYAARALRKAPGFAFAVVATLAVGSGLVTSVVNVAQPILWPNLPFPESGQLVVLREFSPRIQRLTFPVALRFTAYAKHATVFSAMGAERLEFLNLVVSGEPFTVRVSAVTEGFFPALGVSCPQGRLFGAEDFQPDRQGETVVLSHAAWTKFFGRDPAVVGRDVMLGDRLRRIIGVMGPGFTVLPSTSDAEGIYLASALAPGSTTPVTAIGRLKPGRNLEQANAELRTIRPEMPGPPSQFYSELQPTLTSFADAVRENRAQPFRIFIAAAGALYLIGGTTVANLMLSRAVSRRRELAVRLALGGTASRLARLIVVEALLLALIGAGAGTLLATWAQSVMVHLTPAGIDVVGAAGFPARTFGIALLLGISVCVPAAWLPARAANRVGLIGPLKEGAGAMGDSPRLRLLRNTFVVAQSACAVALLIGAGLLLRTVGQLQRIDLGFDPANKLVLSGSRKSPAAPERVAAVNAAIIERIAALPGVAGAARVNAAPLAGSVGLSQFTIDGRAGEEPHDAFGFVIGGDYFETMGIPLLAGTGFGDLRPGSRPVAIINEAIARDYFPDENPVGRFLISDKQRLEIVGVARTVATGYRGTTMKDSKGKPMTPQIYTPAWQSPHLLRAGGLTLIVRAQQQPNANLAAELRRAVFDLDPSLVITLKSLDEIVREWSRSERQTLLMLQILSGLALGLAAFGTFSVMAYAVACRRGELGLRLVLGATPGDLMAFVLRRGLLLGCLGIGIGMLGALASSQMIRASLYQTSAHDPAIYAGVAALLLAATIVACWLPARRAAKIDPMVALRAE